MTPAVRQKPILKQKSLALSDLRNIGKAALADFQLLGITSVSELAAQDADRLYRQLSQITQQRQDPCVHDVFTAAIHQAQTGEAVNWWAYTPARQASGTFLTDLVQAA